MLKKLTVAWLVASGLVVAGCASVPMASPEDDRMAKAFAPQPNKANIYIYRNETFGAAVKMPLLFNDQAIGETAAKTYALVEADPGRHALVSKGENTARLELLAEPGKNYFVWQEVKMGILFARSKLQLMSEHVGKSAVAECGLIQSVLSPSLSSPVKPLAVAIAATSVEAAPAPTPEPALPVAQEVSSPPMAINANLRTLSKPAVLRQRPVADMTNAQALTPGTPVQLVNRMVNATGIAWWFVSVNGQPGWISAHELNP